MAEEPSEVGRQIRELREQAGWSVRQLAARARVPASVVSRIETGRTQRLLLESAIRLAKVFGLTVYDLRVRSAENASSEVGLASRRIAWTAPAHLRAGVPQWR